MKGLMKMKNVKRYEVVPDPKRTMNLLRNVGYSVSEAICEITDNAIDAGAKNIYIDTFGETEINKIAVYDDGKGMSQTTLIECFRMGSKTDNDVNKNGKFKIGLKSGSLSIGKKLTVITTELSSNKVFTGIQNLDDIHKHDKFIIDVGENNKYDNGVLFNYNNRPLENGTIVVIEDLDKIQTRSKKEFEIKLKILGRKYRWHIKNGLNIFVNGKKLDIIDPIRDLPHKLLDTKTIDVFKKFDGSYILVDDNKFPEGLTEIGSMILKIYCVYEDEEYLRIRTDLDSSIIILPKNNGIYVTRNNREIMSAQTFGCFSKHHDFSFLRAELFFTGELDEVLGSTFDKTRIVLSDDIRNKLKSIFFPFTRYCMSVKNEKRNSKDSRVKITKGVVDFNKKVEKAKSLSIFPVTNNKENNKFEIEYKQLGLMGTFYDIGISKDKKPIIILNTDHVLYKQYLHEENFNSSVLNALLSLIYPQVLYELNLKPKSKIDMEFKKMRQQCGMEIAILN